MDLQMLSNSLPEIGLGLFRFFHSTGSTNEEAANWADQGAPDLSLVIADEQTSGRGRAGRWWFTPAGAALAFSLVLRFPMPVEPQRLLAQVTALGSLAVSDVLIRDYQLPVEIKWPNDILIRRKKVAGILAEATWQGDDLKAIILGIGVNVTVQAVPLAGELIYPATCVETEYGQPVDRLQFLKAILSRIVVRKQNLETEHLVQEWESRLAFRNEWVQVVSPTNILEGQALGLNLDGALRLRLPDGQVVLVYAGDIRLRLK